MATLNITAIDPDSWRVNVLPLPKGFSRGATYGFCNGHAVGRAEAARSGAAACWWPEGLPELLDPDDKTKHSALGRPANGSVIPGHVRGRDAELYATVWRHDGARVVAEDLHSPMFASTWATGSGGGVVVGMGSPPRKQGELSPDVGLVWGAGDGPTVIQGEGDVRLFATDGVQVAGAVRTRAMLWPTAASEPIDLSPERVYASEIQALDGEWQIGSVWRGMCARAGLWNRTAASFTDLTPKGFETGRAYGGAQGLQVGSIRRKDTTRNGSAACDDRAVLWEGAADRWFDLNGLLSATEFNSSTAWAIAVIGQKVLVCGEAFWCEVTEPGTPREAHSVPTARPVVWSASLAKG